MRRRDEIKAMLKKTIESEMHGHQYEAFIFGSQANCIELKPSDIDIGIITPKGLGAKLYSNLLERMDNLSMLYNVDLVDFHSVTEEFRQAALKNTEVL